MTNTFVDFKNYLRLLLPKERMREINGENIAKQFRILNELKTLKKQVIINYKEHLRYE